MRLAALSAAILGAAILFAMPGPSGTASAQPSVGAPSGGSFQAAMRGCRRVLPVARRFVGMQQAAVQARFRPPRGVIVRYCAMCTRDFRPNRLTFGLDREAVVRSASCG